MYSQVRLAYIHPYNFFHEICRALVVRPLVVTAHWQLSGLSILNDCRQNTDTFCCYRLTSSLDLYGIDLMFGV